MTIPYRTRRMLRSIGIGVLALILVLILVWMIWLLWLDRYVVYTRDGAVLDFTLSDMPADRSPAVPPEQDMTVSIFYNEGEDALNISTELTQLKGYYISGEMLEESMEDVMTLLKKLPAQTPVMVEVKDIVGRFYYSTSLGPAHKAIDTAAMDELIKFLTASDLYAIAKAPALRDYYYGLNNVSDGLPTSKGYLWMEDGTNCYWLNPASEGTLTHLIQTAKELESLGFDEVVFSDFRFPDTNKIVFKGDKTEALANAAKTLVDASGDDRFAISFLVEDTAFVLPQGRSRMYLEGKAAAEAKALAEQSGLADPAVQLVFVTDVNDTRFDAYGALRPITSAQIEE